MKRYAALCLAAVLWASLLVGCGCSGNVAVTTDPTTQPTTATTTTTAPTTAPTTRPTTAPTTQPSTRPTTAPSTGTTDATNGNDGNMDTDRGTIPNEGTTGTGRNRTR